MTDDKKFDAASLYLVWAEAFVRDNRLYLTDPNDLKIYLRCSGTLREMERRAEQNRTEVKIEAFKELLNVLSDIPVEDFTVVIDQISRRISEAMFPILWFNAAPNESAFRQLLEWKLGQRTEFDFRSGR